jgi:hypothetical protein
VCAHFRATLLFAGALNSGTAPQCVGAAGHGRLAMFGALLALPVLSTLIAALA